MKINEKGIQEDFLGLFVGEFENSNCLKVLTDIKTGILCMKTCTLYAKGPVVNKCKDF